MDERQRQSVTISAKTVNEAIAEAEQQLGLPREELDITIINEGSRGFLGMGAENARILAVSKAVLTGRPPTKSEAVAPAAPLRQAPPPAPAIIQPVSPTTVEDEEEAARGEDERTVA